MEASVSDAVEGQGALPHGAGSRAVAHLARTFDREYGGFGAAPKFPHATELALCLREHAKTGELDALKMVELTLAQMADGGIHDQLGAASAATASTANGRSRTSRRCSMTTGPCSGCTPIWRG
jgi:uncharacterized protein YyaL (SSP411 family)